MGFLKTVFGIGSSKKDKYSKVCISHSELQRIRSKETGLEEEKMFKILSEETFEMPVEFAELNLNDNIKERRIAENKNGDKICLATFLTIIHEKLSQKDALSIVLELKSKRTNKNYYMS